MLQLFIYLDAQKLSENVKIYRKTYDRKQGEALGETTHSG